jgi:Aerotolerance regulator N-terminal/von Willebrand factor type A domain
MSLLAPLFLLGLVSIALPLWLHRLRVRSPERQPFSSAMLLSPDEQRLRLQQRLRYRTLLALRIALLALACLAFAEPVWEHRMPAVAGAPALQLIVLDTSLSMSAGGHFERARAEARSLIDGLHGARALLASAADHLELLSVAGTGPTSDHAALLSAVAGMKPSAQRLDFGSAVASLDGLLADQHGSIDVHLISDFQDSGAPLRFAELLPTAAPGRSIALLLHPIAPGAASPNWAVSAVRRGGAGIDVLVRGFHTPALGLEVALEVNGNAQGRTRATVPAAGEAVFHFEPVRLAEGDNRVVARLIVSDALDADNVRYAVIRNTVAEAVPVLVARADAPAAKYIAAAFKAAGGAYRADVQAPAAFDARALSRYRWLIVADLGSIDGALAAALQSFLRDGGAVFAALGPASALRPSVPLLGDALENPSAAEAGEPLGIGQVDGTHPVLADLRSWQSIEVAHLIALRSAPGDRVLISAGNGVPLLLERQVGRGRVLLYTSSLDNDWNDLPVQPLFVGLLDQIGRYLGGRGNLGQAFTVGASLGLGHEGGEGGQIIDPFGRTVLSLADTRHALTVRLGQAGFYEVYTPAEEAVVAVNPDLRESDLAPMSPSLLERWGQAASVVRTASSEAVEPARAGTPLARTLLALLALVVLAESLLGNRYLQRIGTGAARA